MEAVVNTAKRIPVFMTDETDRNTGKASLSLTVTLCKQDENTFSSISPTVTELGNGWYDLAFTSTHNNTLGISKVHVTASGANPSDLILEVVSAAPNVNVSSIANDAITAAAIAAGAIDAATFAADVAALIRGYLGLAAANLDTQINTLSTHSAADVWSAVTRTLTANTNLNDPSAAAIVSAMEGVGTKLSLISDIEEGDHYIDKTGSPWQLVITKKGTGGPGVGTELVRKDINDVDGTALVSTATVRGQFVEPA